MKSYHSKEDHFTLQGVRYLFHATIHRADGRIIDVFVCSATIHTRWAWCFDANSYQSSTEKPELI